MTLLAKQWRLRIKVKQLLLLIIMILCVLIVLAGETIEKEGVDVITRYLSALARGDTDAAKSLIGGAFLRKRQRLFDNPEYCRYLVKKYNNARFEIQSIRPVGSETLYITVLTELENGERFRLEYKIIQVHDESLRIVAESIPQAS